MSLLKSLFSVEVHNANDAVVRKLASTIPADVGKAQIKQQEEAVAAAAQVVASYAPKVDAALAHLNEVNASIEQHKKAMGLLIAAAEAATDPTLKAAKEATFTKLEAETKHLIDDQSSSKQAYEDASTRLAHYKESYDRAMDVLTGMKKAVDEAIQAQADAKDAVQDAKQREHDEKVLAGIDTDLNSGTAALDAIRQNTARLKAQAAASAMQADSLARKHIVDDDVHAALAEAAGTAAPASGGSLAERLAALQAH